jgi:3-dehydroquinate synthetase
VLDFARRFETPSVASYRQPIRGRDGVHVRTRDGEREWCVRHRAEGIAYTIRETPGLFGRDDIAQLGPRQHLIVDSGAEHHGRELARNLANGHVEHWVYPVRGGEGCKTTDEWERLTAAVQANAHRRDLIVAVGGGAVCDLARCVAAWLWKGVPLAVVPTTPTAYIDASIGVKGALNRESAKNAGGVYYPALLVALDLGLVETCAPDVLRAGLLETAKMALIMGGRCWELWEHQARDVLTSRFQGGCSLELSRLALTGMVQRLRPNLREHELRRPVDLGHLLVSLLELDAGLLHGVAVGVDLALMAEYAALLGLLPDGERARVHGTIRAIGAPIYDPSITVDRVQATIAATRRQRGGRVNLPVPERIGRVRVHPAVDDAAMREAVLRLRSRAGDG